MSEHGIYAGMAFATRRRPTPADVVVTKASGTAPEEQTR